MMMIVTRDIVIDLGEEEAFEVVEVEVLGEERVG
jgi:hypothetical protein